MCRIHRRPRRGVGALELSRLSPLDLHLGQPRGVPRHSRRQAPGRRRHRQYRRHPHRRWLARRFQPHVLRRQGRHQGAQAGGNHLRGVDAGHRHRQARRHPGRYRLGHPEPCREAAFQRGARLLRPRPGPHLPRAAQRHALRRARTGHRLEGRHVLHHRADDQCRPRRHQDPGRRLDGGDQGQVAVGAVRTLDRRHRHRLRNLHRLAGRAALPPLLASSVAILKYAAFCAFQNHHTIQQDSGLLIPGIRHANFGGAGHWVYILLTWNAQVRNITYAKVSGFPPKSRRPSDYPGGWGFEIVGAACRWGHYRLMLAKRFAV
ncbi:hypothetical protein MTBLM5_130020 [Magnetospirillum sp. LM-5]|nr:hypothetical protein MTBLM5_130020 [Magnetospirillum sp. LM-5]